MLDPKYVKNYFSVYSVVELDKIIQLLFDFRFACNLLLSEPNNKKASRLMENSYLKILEIIDPKMRVKFTSVNDAMLYKINNESEDI